MMANERKVVKAGYLVKSPPQEKLMAQWHRRYFILWSTKLMEYYTSHEHKPQDYLKTINLSNCEDMVAPLPITNRPHIIKLSVRCGAKLRDYYLDCGTEEEMLSWIKCLAKVCGFAPVDENEESIYSVASDPEDQPVYDDIEDEVHHRLKEKPHPAKPPTNLKSAFSLSDIEQMVYEEPMVDMDPNNNYHMLKDNGSLESTLDKGVGVREEWYDDMGINDTVVYNMNKRPPPIWRPDVEERLAPPLPPNRRAISSEPEERLRVLLDKNRPQLPIPPPKPPKSSGAAFSPSRGSGQDLFGIKDNPLFKQKLQEKRQALYGDSRQRSLSMGEGEDLAHECYESVLYTVDDNVEEEVPKLPPRTEILRNECLSQLFARKGAGGGIHHGRPPSMPESRSARTSPRHGVISPTTPTSPPPLPSRELLDPTLPSYRGSPQPPPMTRDEEVPPPVPLRDSSKQAPYLSFQESMEKRRNSSPTSTRIDRSKPLPLPVYKELEPPPQPQHSSSHPRDIRNRLHPQDRALPPTPPELTHMQERKLNLDYKQERALPHQEGAVDTEQLELVYDDVVPGCQSPNEKETYDASSPPIQQSFATDPWALPQKSNVAALPPRPAMRQQKETSPMSNGLLPQQQVPKWQKEAASPIRKVSSEPSPQPKWQKDVPPMRELTNELLSQQRASKNPPLPPSKPKIADIAPGSRGQGTVGNGVAGDQSSIKSKPQVARKPPPPKKPVGLAAKKPPPPVSKKPPTQPKPAKIPSSTGASPPSAKPPLPAATKPPQATQTSSAKPLPPQILRHKPKPVVPKKPIIPLCS